MPGSKIDLLEKQIEQNEIQLKVVDTKLKQLQAAIQQVLGIEHLELSSQNLRELKPKDPQQQKLKKTLQTLPAYQQYLSYRNYYVELFQEQYKLMKRLIQETQPENEQVWQHSNKHIECTLIQEKPDYLSMIQTQTSPLKMVPQSKKIVKKYE